MKTPKTIEIPDTKVSATIVLFTEEGKYLSQMQFANIPLTIINEAMEHINVNG